MSFANVSKTPRCEPAPDLATLLTHKGLVGIWYWNVKLDLVFTDADFAALFSLAPEVASRGAPVDAFVAGIDERDRKRVKEALRLSLIAGTDFLCRYRLMAQRKVRALSAYARCYCDADGRTSHYIGVALNDDAPSMTSSDQVDPIVDHAFGASRLAAKYKDSPLNDALRMVLLDGDSPMRLPARASWPEPDVGTR